MHTTSSGTEVKRVLVGIKELAEILSVSRTMVYKMKASGKLPMPITTLGRSLKWGRREIELWVDNRCPPIDKWEKIRPKLKQYNQL